MEKVKEKLLIVKVGSSVIEQPDELKRLVKNLVAIKCRKLLVHGGRTISNKIAKQIGVKVTRKNNHRIFTDELMDVVTMVNGGLVNKRIVSLLQWNKINAIGLVGADMNVITSERQGVVDGIDYGWVGIIKKVNGKALAQLIEGGFMPVLAPLSHDGKSHLLSTDANDIAAEVAKALARRYDVVLAYCFDKRGVLMSENNEDSVIQMLKHTQFSALCEMGILKGERAENLRLAFTAIDYGVKEVIITNADQLCDLTLGTHVR